MLYLYIWSWVADRFIDYGYLGLFTVSFAGSIIVFVPAPYFIPVALASMSPLFDPLITTVASALGSTLAKTVIFRASYMGERFLSPESKSRIRPFQKVVARYGWIAAFFAAATPMPDDVVYIPLGFTKYSLWRFIAATFAGKLIITGIVAFGARLFGLSFIQPLTEGPVNTLLTGFMVGILIFVVVMTIYAILKLDWANLLQRWLPWAVE